MLSFLIDECLSPKLCDEARARGFHAMHINHLDMSSYRDQVLAAYAIAKDHVLVTNNGVDYRPIYRSLDVHPGLVVIIPSLKRPQQVDAFNAVLATIEHERDLINKLIEVTADGIVTISDFPPFRDNL